MPFKDMPARDRHSGSPAASRRRLLQGTVLLATGLGTRRAWAQPKTLLPVTLAIHYLPRGDYAPYHLARTRGYYAERGLDLAIRHVVGNALALQSLLAGSAQFAHADMTQMLQSQLPVQNPACAASQWRPGFG